MSTYVHYNDKKAKRYDMPWGLLIFVAGLVTYFVTEYDTLGMILMGVGGALFLIGVLFFLSVLFLVKKLY